MRPLSPHVGDQWVARWGGERVEVVHVFEDHAQTLHFSTEDYHGDVGQVLIADCNHLNLRRVVPMDVLQRDYARDELRHRYQDSYRTAVPWEPER